MLVRVMRRGRGWWGGGGTGRAFGDTARGPSVPRETAIGADWARRRFGNMDDEEKDTMVQLRHAAGSAATIDMATATLYPEIEAIPVRLRAGVGGRRQATRVYQFRWRDDASVAPDAAVCAAAPFEPTVSLGALLLPQDSSTVDGEVTDSAPIGTATACIHFSNSALPVGHAGRFYAAFDLPEGRVIAEGTVGVISSDLAVSGVVLAACSLRVVSAPAGVRGGMATSLSVFYPGRVHGFATGSFWTLRLYVDE